MSKGIISFFICRCREEVYYCSCIFTPFNIILDINCSVMYLWYRTNVDKYLIFLSYTCRIVLSQQSSVYMKDQFNTNASQPKTRKKSRELNYNAFCLPKDVHSETDIMLKDIYLQISHLGFLCSYWKATGISRMYLILTCSRYLKSASQ